MFQFSHARQMVCVSLLLVLVTACTWVRPDPGAEDVLVLPEARLGDCERLGSVEVSVLARVIGMDRHEEEIEADLAVLARNHAAERGADTVSPLSEVKDGKQRFAVYSCQGSARQGSPERDDSEENDDDGVVIQEYDG